MALFGCIGAIAWAIRGSNGWGGIGDAMVEVLRKKTITERIEMVFAANRTMRKMMAEDLRTDHPDWSDEQIQAEIARRILAESSEIEINGTNT